MKTVVFALALAITGIVLAGEQKAPPATTAHIEGIVVDAMTNRPLPEVILTALQETDGRNAITNAQGQFSFDTQYGTLRVVTSKDGDTPVSGRMATSFPSGAAGVLLTVGAGQRLRDITLRMFPTAAIVGRVFDIRSKPVQYAHAQLWHYVYTESGERSLQQATAVRGGDTNDHGEYRLTGNEPGDYFLKIEPPLMGERITGEPFVPAYFPAATDPAAAVSIAAKSGPDIHLEDITLSSARGGAIHVHLINQTGAKIDNTLEKYLYWGHKGIQGTTARAPLLIMGGPDRAEIPVSLGTYDLAMGWTRKGALIGLGRTTVAVSPFGADVELNVIKGTKLTGRVLLEQPTGQPKPVAGVRCDFSTEGIDSLAAISAQDGSIGIPSVWPAVYRMDCPLLPPGSYISQIRQGDRDVLKDGLNVETSETNVVVTLNGSGATAQGTVTDAKGQKVPNAIVALVPDAPLRDVMYLYRASGTDQLGGFTMRAIVPGAYHVFAWQELEGASYKNAEFMKKVENQGSAVKAERGGKITLDVKILDPSN